MQTIVLAVIGSITAVVSATPAGIPGGVPISCAKANASYCTTPDIILRCDASGLGTTGRCSDNVAGYPPAGGTASCLQSSQEAGDAACVKNCVVYAETPYVLPADKCTPSAMLSDSASSTPAAIVGILASSNTANLETGIVSIPEGTSLGTLIESPETETSILSIPEGTRIPSVSLPAPSFSSASPTKASHTSARFSTSTSTGFNDCPAPTFSRPNPGSSQSGITATPTRQTRGTLTSAITAPVTAGADLNHAAGVMAAAGFAAVLLI